MMILQQPAGLVTLALLFGGLAACSNRAGEDAAPAPVDTAESGAVDTAGTVDTMAAPDAGEPDTSMATPPITPPAEAEQESIPSGEAQPGGEDDQAEGGPSLKVSEIEYEGWRQYSVNCARCHGQDALPNPVAANLLASLGPDGTIGSSEEFMQVVMEGRPERGMPPFKDLLTPEQVDAIYAYVKGRAEDRISAGRPERPQA